MEQVPYPETQNGERYFRGPELANYNIRSFTEDTDPISAFKAQQIHGESYVSHGFVYDTALDEYGRLQPELDRSRGAGVVYYLADAITSEESQATLRTKNPQESLDELPAWRYCDNGNSLYPESKEALKDFVIEHGVENIKEIMALGNTNMAAASGSHELIRHLVQSTIHDDKSEMWLITFTHPAFESMRRTYGNEVIKPAGEPVSVDNDDPRTSDTLKLIPTIVNPNTVPEDILRSIEQLPENQTKVRNRLSRTLLFMTDGLNEDEVNPKVQEYLHKATAAEIPVPEEA